MPFLPEALIAPLRLIADDALAEMIFSDPLLFAVHFANVDAAISWPENIAEVRQAVHRRYQRHDEVLALLEKLRDQMPLKPSAELAKLLAEGLEIHHLIAAKDYRTICDRQLAIIQGLEDCSLHSGDLTAGRRIAEISTLLGLTRAQTRLLTFALVYTVVPHLQLLTALLLDRPLARQGFWKAVLDLEGEALAEAISPHGRLAGSGLITIREHLPEVPSYWSKVLLDTESPLMDLLVEPLEYKQSPDGASRLPAEDRDIVLSLLKQDGPVTGINVLLYGRPAVDKINLAHHLIREAGKVPYVLVDDIPERDRASAVMVAQKLLRGQASTAPVLVIPSVQPILARVILEDILLFGVGTEQHDTKPLDERILSENPLPTVWITTDPRRLHAETLARFLFHAQALRGTRADRSALVESLIAALPLAATDKLELTRLEGLSAQQLMAARTVADLTAGDDTASYTRHLRITAMRSQKALSRRGKDEARLPVTTYSLDYLHAAGRFGPRQIVQAYQRQPHGSLCLYGLPGTGKTQFAEHLATELARPILIKRASEILDKYVGESEKRIAEMFDEAEEEDALLLLDEADSFLRDRSLSRHSWEVSTVNELLQRMERFSGIFVCTTNLFSQIDAAALRRFTFKLELLPLTIDQRWQMFCKELGLPSLAMSEALHSVYEERLALMQDLTPGDFATVKRQCQILGEDLSAEQWLEQLEIEVRAKARSDSRVGELQATGD
jgi:hypothetical protein